MSSIDQPGSMGARHFMPAPHEFSDEESHYLLVALYCYCEYYDITADSIADLASELAMSQDKTTTVQDQMRSALEARFT